MASQSERSTKRRHRKGSYEDGQAEAKAWLQENHPVDIQELLRFIGWWMSRTLRAPWKDCPVPELQENLAHYGRAYTFGFFDEVRNAYQAIAPAYVYRRHHEGVQDGHRWASDFASENQLTLIRAFSREQGHRDLFVGPYFGCCSWTPSHELVAYLFDGRYPVDEEGELLIDCKEFRDFWQPFVDEPMDELVPNLESVAFHGRHKLQSRHYVIGFVDGALGLSEQLGRDLRELSMPSLIYRPAIIE